jgi:hypothetical protein
VLSPAGGYGHRSPTRPRCWQCAPRHRQLTPICCGCFVTERRARHESRRLRPLDESCLVHDRDAAARHRPRGALLPRQPRSGCRDRYDESIGLDLNPGRLQFAPRRHQGRCRHGSDLHKRPRVTGMVAIGRRRGVVRPTRLANARRKLPEVVDCDHESLIK